MVTRPFFIFQSVADLMSLSSGILRYHDVARACAGSFLRSCQGPVEGVGASIFPPLKEFCRAPSRTLRIGHKEP